MSPRTQAPVRIVHVAFEAMPDTLVVVDAGRRTYLGLSTDRTYWHSVRPARLDDPVVGDGKRAVGELLCSCVAGEYGRPCYWTEIAAACERGDRGFIVDRIADPSWVRPAPAGVEA